MTLIFCDGFDDNLPKWDGGNAVPKVAGRNGQAGQPAGGGTYTKTLDPADVHQTMIWGMAVKWDSPPYGVWTYLSMLGSDGSEHFAVKDTNNSYGRDYVFYAAGVARYTWSTMQSGVYTYLEIKLRVHDTTGLLEVRANGVLLFSFTGDTKAGAGTDTVNAIRISNGGGANGGPWQIDDMYLCNGAGSVNNDFMGDLAIETIFPSGPGDEIDFMGSDGNQIDNHLLVDEATPTLTDWTAGAAVGDRDLYAMNNLTRTNGVVYGVIASGYLQNSDSGPRSAGTVVKSGSTVGSPAGIVLDTSPAISKKVHEVNPDTGTAWTVAAINAMQVGAEVTA